MHYLLLLPLIGIVVFFIFPLSIAIPVYLFVLIISGLMYWIIYRAMKKQPNFGREGLIGTQARVISKLDPGEEAQYMVRIRGESWRANSTEVLALGDIVKITAVDGLILIVEKPSVKKSL